MLKTPASVGGAGIGTLKKVKKAPTTIPVNNAYKFCI